MKDALSWRWTAKLHRGAAALLLAVTLLCALAGQALAAEEKPSALSANTPAVVVEGNAVKDTNGNFTGDFELALKVRTKFENGTEHPFRSAAVALRFDTNLIQPVSWSYKNGDPILPIPTMVSRTQPFVLETKKPDTGITATAKVEAYAPTPGTALLVLYAESINTAISYEKETAVCVVRFRYNKQALTLSQTDSFAFLQTVQTPVTQPGKSALVWFAGDTDAADSTAGQSVWYQGTVSIGNRAQTYFYHCLNAANPSTPATMPATDGLVANTGIGNVKDYASHFLTAQQETASPTRPALPAEPGKVQFKLVNGPTYAGGGVELGNLATILFYDWDDSLLGVLTVEKGDARAKVNEFVRDNFIHPDLRAADPGSLERKDTYRGEYPAEGPSGSTKDPVEGPKFALTNKLDYAFYRRPTKKVTPTDGSTEYWDYSALPAGDPARAWPYIWGWAIVPKSELKNSADYWTTFGSGELEKFDHDYFAGNTQYTTKGTAAKNFELKDFSALGAELVGDAKDKPVTYYVRACYEQGKELSKDADYTQISGPHYVRYGAAGSSITGTVYSIKYQYGRISGDKVGVKRARTPSLKVLYMPDINGIDGKPFYQETGTSNKDIVDIEITPSADIKYVRYSFVDSYGVDNFVVAAARTSFGNLVNLPNNFNYTDYPGDLHYGSEGLVYRATLNQILNYGTRALGSGTATDLDRFKNALAEDTFKDLNLRFDSLGMEIIDTFDIAEAQTRVLDAISDAIAAGETVDDIANLGWHQLQYHIINPSAGFKSEADCIAVGFAWCRLGDNCGGNGPSTITNLQDLLQAGYKKYVDSAHSSSAIDNLTNGDLTLINSLCLRANPNGDEFTNIADFKTALETALIKLAAAGKTYTTITSIDWIELQHLLIPGKVYQSANDLRVNPTVDYWWENGKTAEISEGDLGALLQAAYKVYVDGGVSKALDNFDLAKLEKLFLRRDDKGHKFTPTDDFKAALKDAVRALKFQGSYTAATIKDATWDELQYALIHKAYSPLPLPTTEDYWWKNGDAPAIGGWKDLAEVGYRVYVDGQDSSMFVKLGPMSAVTNAPMWLRKDTEGAPFNSRELMLTALEKAVTALKGAGKNLDYIKTAPSFTWLEFQHMILGQPYRANIDLEADQANGLINYWWYGGGIRPPPTTFSGLLDAAAKYAADSTDTVLDSMELTGVNGNGINLRKSLDGQPYTIAADLTDFIASIKKMTADAVAAGKVITDLSWNEVQYYLAHNNSFAPTKDIAEAQGSKYYWWYNGGGKAISLSATDMKTWAEAAYRAKVYGEPHVWDNLTPAKLESVYFVKGPTTDITTWAGLPKYDVNDPTDRAAFTTAMGNLVADAIDQGRDYETLTWHEIQNYLLGNPYMAQTSAMVNAHWWINGQDKPSGIDTKFIEFRDMMSEFAAGTTTSMSWFTPARASVATLAFKKAVGSGSGTAFGTLDGTTLQNRLKALINAVKALPDPNPYWDGTALNLTWYQVQYALLTTTGTLTDPDIARAADYSWAPQWAKDAYPMPGSGSLSLNRLEVLIEELPPEEEPVPTEPETPPVKEESMSSSGGECGTVVPDEVAPVPPEAALAPEFPVGDGLSPTPAPIPDQLSGGQGPLPTDSTGPTSTTPPAVNVVSAAPGGSPLTSLLPPVPPIGDPITESPPWAAGTTEIAQRLYFIPPDPDSPSKSRRNHS